MIELNHKINSRGVLVNSIIDMIEVNITVTDNPYNIPVDTLFSMAARKNKKRGFLFVSKILGKHIPVVPAISLLGGAALAVRYMEERYEREHPIKYQLIESLITQQNAKETWVTISEHPYLLPDKTVVIGFAETATALGHALFDCFRNAEYVHTTREQILDIDSTIRFEEEHSHATSQRFYADPSSLKNDYPIMLVDDEITTGKTALNIIDSLQKQFPRKEYTLVSLLDWRSEEDKQKFKEKERELGISIRTVALISGSIMVKGEPVELEGAYEYKTGGEMIQPTVIKHLRNNVGIECPVIRYSSIDSTGEVNTTPYLKWTGRFGLTDEAKDDQNLYVRKIGETLGETRTGPNTLCLGTGEFMYIPMKIAFHMGEGTVFQSTTRSPIHRLDRDGYAVRSGFSFPSPDDPSVTNYFYNIPYGHYDDIYLFIERALPDDRLSFLLDCLKEVGTPRIHVIVLSGTQGPIAEPTPIGSYDRKDVTFLLKDISDVMEESDTEDREEAIQSGTHYSEMLPIEYKPNTEYMQLFHSSLEASKKKLAQAIGVVAEKIVKERGHSIVLVSLARGGTPIGILIKRYLFFKYNMNVPHFSVSIIRGRGIDVNAIRYILETHPDRNIQFIDGWTGKGAITKELSKSCKNLKRQTGLSVSDHLAVLADPGHCASIYGTREDFLIPSACLNSTVSGLVSRTVLNEVLIGENDFHGAKYYREMEPEDVSNLFIDTITTQFPLIADDVLAALESNEQIETPPNWQGLRDIQRIQQEYRIENINLIKPGVGETTRVLLRRVPWKILVKDRHNECLKHILLLAEERGVEVEQYDNMSYMCCGLIKPLRSKRHDICK